MIIVKNFYSAFEFRKIETKEDIEAFSIGISPVEIKKYLSLNYKLFIFKKYG